MACAFRPRLSPKSMASRYSSQVLVRGLGCGDAACPRPVSGGTAPPSSRWDGLRSVITSGSVIASLAGFEVAFAFPLVERFSGLGLGLGFPATAGFAGPESVITSLAGFGARRPQPLGGRTAIPAAFRYALAVSRRMRVACWICRSDHPSRPRAKTCCFFSSFKTLAMPMEATSPPRVSMSQTPLSLAGFQVILIGRFWVIAEALVPLASAARTTSLGRGMLSAGHAVLPRTRHRDCRCQRDNSGG